MKSVSDESAQKTAEHILKIKSPFVTDEIKLIWVKTAILDAYAKGRSDVYHEEMNTFFKGDEK